MKKMKDKDALKILLLAFQGTNEEALTDEELFTYMEIGKSIVAYGKRELKRRERKHSDNM